MDLSTDNSSNPFVILLVRLIPAVSIILKFSPNQFKFTKIGSVVVPDFGLVSTLFSFVIELSKVDFPTLGLPTIANFTSSLSELNSLN